jgi:predicted nucleic-acid-binding Zn-ribbon protein
MATRVAVDALLGCGCTVSFNPVVKKGEAVTCRRHGSTDVIDPDLKQWIATCSGCGYSEGFGAARLGAEIGGAKHRQRVRTEREKHVVTLWSPTGQVHRRYGVSNDQDTLFGNDVTES